MVVLIEFSVPPESFKLGSLLRLSPDTKVNVEQIVPVGNNIMPFSWVTGDIENFERGLKKSGMSYEVVVEDDQKDRKLYRLEWEADGDGLVQAVLASDGSVLDAVGTSEEWVFRVRFRERADLSEFHRRSDKRDLDIQVNRIYNPIEVSGDSRAGMTLMQTETMIKALEAGYFEIPRKTSLVELSEGFGVSDQAVSERLRRATGKLIESSLIREDEDLSLKEVVNS